VDGLIIDAEDIHRCPCCAINSSAITAGVKIMLAKKLRVGCAKLIIVIVNIHYDRSIITRRNPSQELISNVKRFFHHQ
jgi:hypothetical protein